MRTLLTFICLMLCGCAIGQPIIRNRFTTNTDSAAHPIVGGSGVVTNSDGTLTISAGGGSAPVAGTNIVVVGTTVSTVQNPTFGTVTASLTGNATTATLATSANAVNGILTNQISGVLTNSISGNAATSTIATSANAVNGVLTNQISGTLTNDTVGLGAFATNSAKTQVASNVSSGIIITNVSFVTGSGAGLTGIPLTGLTATANNGNILSNNNGTIVLAASPTGGGGPTGITTNGFTNNIANGVDGFYENVQYIIATNTGNGGLVELSEVGPSDVVNLDYEFNGGIRCWEISVISNTFGIFNQDNSASFRINQTTGLVHINKNILVDGPTNVIASTQMGKGVTNTADGFNGIGSGLTSLNASQLTSGTVADPRLSTNAALLNGTQNWAGAQNMTNPANSFTGNGGGLTNLNAANLTGTQANGTESTNDVLKNANNVFIGTNTFTNSITLTNSAGTNVIGSSGQTNTAGGNILFSVASGATPTAYIDSASRSLAGVQSTLSSGHIVIGNNFHVVVDGGVSINSMALNTSGSLTNATLAGGLSIGFTNSAPTGVTVGVTAADTWVPCTIGGTVYYVPAWKNH